MVRQTTDLVWPCSDATSLKGESTSELHLHAEITPFCNSNNEIIDKLIDDRKKNCFKSSIPLLTTNLKARFLQIAIQLLKTVSVVTSAPAKSVSLPTIIAPTCPLGPSRVYCEAA
jgi:hypothetical protein